MQRLTQKFAATAILLLFPLVHAQADDTAAVSRLVKTSPATIQFVKVYIAYAKAVRDHGVESLKTFITSDFALRGQGPPLTGKAAFKEIDACRVDLPGTRFSAAVHPLSVNGTDVVALSQETYTSPFNFHNHTGSMAAAYEWKQSWRKTPQGWKLASLEAYRGDFAHAKGITFTVLPEAKSEPVEVQGKQNVVK